MAEFEKRFSTETIIYAALDGFQTAFGVAALFGPSGCGKTTILRCLAGLERPDRGKIQFQDEVWFDAERNINVPAQQRRVGYVFQDYALFPHLTVEKNIAYGLKTLPEGARSARVGEMLDFFHLRGLEKRLPRHISGGQQQRVALARALAPKPRLLLLDEPLSAVDAPTRELLRTELQRSIRDMNTPAIIVTHDRLEALVLSDHMTVLNAGRVLQSGATRDIFRRPANLDVARIVGVDTVLNGEHVQSSEGLSTVQVSGVQLTGVATLAPANGHREVHVCIRAEDVILQKGTPTATSARNQLSGRVRAISPEGALVRVMVDCGFPLRALITKHACEDLDLQNGETVIVLLKASAIHILPAHPPRL